MPAKFENFIPSQTNAILIKPNFPKVALLLSSAVVSSAFAAHRGFLTQRCALNELDRSTRDTGRLCNRK